MSDARPAVDYAATGQISVVQAYASTDRIGRPVAAAENIRHEPRGGGARNVMFSKNVTNILPVSADVDGLRSDMTYAQIGNRITCINENAFAGCSSLAYVAASPNLKKILDGAFEDCESLSTFEPFSYSYPWTVESNAGKYIYTIGRRAFANTDLRDITINLQGGTYDNPDADPALNKSSNPKPYADIGVSAFAGCKNLKSVKMTYGTYLSKGMFQGCSSLTSVQLVNRHSFINSDVFRDCTALGRMSYPPSFYEVPNRMFYGCTSLSSVVFNEPSDMKHIGRHSFYGCSSLTSLTLPVSISSLTQLDNEFLLCSNVQRLEFKGIPSERLFTGADEEQLDINTEKFYCDANREKLLKSLVAKNEKLYIARLSAVLKTRELDIDDFLTFTSHDNLKEIVSTCIQKQIPIIFFSSNVINECTYCKHFLGQVFFTQKFKDFINSAESKKFVKILEEDSTRADIYKNIFLKEMRGSIPGFDRAPYGSQGFVIHIIYQRGNNTYAYKEQCDEKFSIENMKSSAVSVLKTAGETGSNVSDIITSNIFENKCFGAYKDVKLIGSDGKSAMYKNTANYIEVPPIYQSMVPVDNDTKSDFRYGIWYGSPAELREYADKYNIPVFVQLGSIGCPPCQVFTQEVYCDPEFQAFVKKQKCLFCRVVAPSTESGPGGYILNWAGNAMVPQTMYYWKKSNEETFISSMYYAGEWGNKYDASDISGWITECFKDYEPDPKFYPVKITEFYEAVPRYRRYDNQFGDLSGTYFPCVEKTENRDDSKACRINGADYTIRVGNQSEIPPGTYQYFPMLSTDSTYDGRFDMSGFVFSVGPVEQFITSSDVRTTFAEYDASLARALGETGPVLTNMIDDVVNDGIYKFDDDKDEFVQPLEIEDGVDAADMYNYEAEYDLGGKVLDGQSLTRIVIRQLCDASLDEDGLIDVDPSSGIVRSVLVYGLSQGSVVNWLYDFSNVSEDD